MNEQKEVIKSVSWLIVIIMVVIFILAGCTTVPVVAKFPENPSKSSIEACPNLQKLNDDAKLSDISKTITINYSTYYECAVKVDTWIEWYKIQKNIFENIK